MIRLTMEIEIPSRKGEDEFKVALTGHEVDPLMLPGILLAAVESVLQVHVREAVQADDQFLPAGLVDRITVLETHAIMHHAVCHLPEEPLDYGQRSTINLN